MKFEDNTLYEKEEFYESGKLVEQIRDKNIGSIDGLFVYPNRVEDIDDLSDDQKILITKGDKYQTQNLVGFIGYGEEQLIIKSRFGEHLFKYLLKEVYDIPNVVKFESSFTYEDFFEYLCFIFPGYLKEAMKKGPFKKYVWKRYNDNNIKGCIDIPRHIKLNTPFVGNVAYNSREFSYDNYLMQLIRHTIEYIRKKQYGEGILFNLKDEIRIVEELTPSYSFFNRKRIIELNYKWRMQHSYYKEYSKLQKICIMILTHKMMDYSKSADRVYGILFDCATLWEEYVYILIKDKFYHPNNRIKLLGQNFFKGYKDQEERKKGLFYPDFIGKDTTNRLIADAKYKPLGNIMSTDYMQILSYMFRFDSKKGYFFYPQKKDDYNINGEVLNLLQGVDIANEESAKERKEKITVEKIGIIIDNNEDFSEFVREMKSSEKNFLERLSNN